MPSYGSDPAIYIRSFLNEYELTGLTLSIMPRIAKVPSRIVRSPDEHIIAGKHARIQTTRRNANTYFSVSPGKRGWAILEQPRCVPLCFLLWGAPGLFQAFMVLVQTLSDPSNHAVHRQPRGFSTPGRSSRPGSRPVCGVATRPVWPKR